MKRQKRTQIGISYWSNPNKSNHKCHKDNNSENLIAFRTFKFAIKDYKKAWAFLESCDKPETTLKQILWAFPKKEAFTLLSLEKEEQDIVMTFEEIKEAQNITEELADIEIK